MVVAAAMVVGFATLFDFGLSSDGPTFTAMACALVLQVLTIVLVIPFAAYLAYWLTTGGDPSSERLVPDCKAI